MAPKILVVDDERGIADTIAEIISDARYDVRCCYSGAEAIDILDNFEPDLLLTDVLMPGINGFELALATKRRFSACRLLLFSGQASTAIVAQNFINIFNKHGYRFELLPKPLHPDVLLSKIEEALLQAV